MAGSAGVLPEPAAVRRLSLPLGAPAPFDGCTFSGPTSDGRTPTLSSSSPPVSSVDRADLEMTSADQRGSDLSRRPELDDLSLAGSPGRQTQHFRTGTDPGAPRGCLSRRRLGRWTLVTTRRSWSTLRSGQREGHRRNQRVGSGGVCAPTSPRWSGAGGGGGRRCPGHSPGELRFRCWPSGDSHRRHGTRRGRADGVRLRSSRWTKCGAAITPAGASSCPDISASSREGDRRRRLSVEPWASGVKTTLVALTAETIGGRRLGPAPLASYRELIVDELGRNGWGRSEQSRRTTRRLVEPLYRWWFRVSWTGWSGSHATVAHCSSPTTRVRFRSTRC